MLSFTLLQYIINSLLSLFQIYLIKQFKFNVNEFFLQSLNYFQETLFTYKFFELLFLFWDINIFVIKCLKYLLLSKITIGGILYDSKGFPLKDSCNS